MVDLRSFIGKTLGELAETTNMSYYPIRVFLIDDEANDAGRFLAMGYSLRRVVNACPAVANATVVVAKDYIRETIIRVKF